MTDVEPEPHVADTLSVRDGVVRLARMLSRGLGAGTSAIAPVRVPSRIEA